MKENVLVDKSFEFALMVVSLYKSITGDRKEFVLSKQLLRSGTSIGANIREAQNAESKQDFIHKLAIAQKECDETAYWLELLHRSNYITVSEFTALRTEADSLLRMLRSAILTTKQNLRHNNS